MLWLLVLPRQKSSSVNLAGFKPGGFFNTVPVQRGAHRRECRANTVPTLGNGLRAK